MTDKTVVYGEVKGMTLGQMKISTNYMGTVYIEWDFVEQFESQYNFQVEVDNGTKYFGRIEKASEPRRLVVAAATGHVVIAMKEIVRINPIETTFIARINGYLNLGFSYAQSSNVIQLTFDWSVTYRSQVNSVAFSASVTLNATEGETTTQRQSYGLVYQHLLTGKWFGSGGVGLQQNQAMGVDFRQLIYAAPGYHLVQTRHDILSASAGLDINNELGTDSTAYRQTLEAMLSLAYSLFEYEGLTTNVDVGLVVFPSLTESGRIRADLRASAGREIVNNLNVTLSGWYSYDNKPPSADAADADSGIVLSVGWSY